jgi:DNA-binding NarL/FixJ family response regulator
VTRVLLVDDDALVRSGLRMMLAGAEGIEVVGEAGDGCSPRWIATAPTSY